MLTFRRQSALPEIMAGPAYQPEYMLLEVCCYGLESALSAQQTGADRIELCADPLQGGTTPSLGLIKVVRSRLHIPLDAIIRPRGGDFMYSKAEFDVMINDLETCKQAGCDGAVLGILKQDGKVDMERCRQLVDLAYPLGVTFHRAFDWTADAEEAMEDIISLGCERILTSGQAPTAAQGTDLIAALVSKADYRITIMPGAGIRAENIGDLVLRTGASEYHSSARMNKITAMGFLNIKLDNSEADRAEADPAEIAGMLAILARHSQ